MRRYKCPICFSTSSVIRHSKRGTSIRFKCKGCIKFFSIKTVHVDKKRILSDHLDGLSFRALAVKHSISPMTAWRICEEKLVDLPDNNKFTHTFCNRFSDIYVFDGKYLPIKGYDNGYCLLWGIDYLKHDIPIFTLAPSESYSSWRTNFGYFRIINNYPRLVVCDDNQNIKLAARNAFPEVKIQTCFNHFKEGMRRNLKVRSDPTYKPFMKRVEDVLKEKLTDQAMNKKLYSMYVDYREDPVCMQVLTTIEKYKPELLGYGEYLVHQSLQTSLKDSIPTWKHVCFLSDHSNQFPMQNFG